MNTKAKNYAMLIALIFFVLRLILAIGLEFGNDEVYYWTYVMFPDWSHFDHPPMLGYLAQITTLNLTFTSEVFLRMPGLIIGLINSFLIFRIASRLKDDYAGIYAVCLYNASFYLSVIAGVFIMPDTPMVLFWMLAINSLLKVFSDDTEESIQKKNLVLSGLFIGLAMLSKYHSAFLWSGAIAYILLFRRKWLLKKELYFALLLTFICISPIIFWNISNDFISYTFHSSRVGVSKSLRIDYIASEIFGSVFYNNPANYIIIFIALIGLIKQKLYKKQEFILLLLISIPMIATFIGFSLFKRTLPHWSGPAFTNLIIIASAILSLKFDKQSIKPKLPISIKITIVTFLLVIVSAFMQVNYGIFVNEPAKDIYKAGRKDISLDMFGWKQLRAGIQQIADSLPDKSNLVITSHRWFPSANIDYYVAYPLNIKFIAMGDMGDVHKYSWINKYRNYINSNNTLIYITSSRDFKDPENLYSEYFNKIEKIAAIPIYRSSVIVYYFHVYKMTDYKNNFKWDM